MEISQILSFLLVSWFVVWCFLRSFFLKEREREERKVKNSGKRFGIIYWIDIYIKKIIHKFKILLPFLSISLIWYFLFLGGDGTFLATAQYIKSNEIPLIGVNTDPTKSQGLIWIMKLIRFELIDRLVLKLRWYDWYELVILKYLRFYFIHFSSLFFNCLFLILYKFFFLTN